MTVAAKNTTGTHLPKAEGQICDTSKRFPSDPFYVDRENSSLYRHAAPPNTASENKLRTEPQNTLLNRPLRRR
jgi:hypothetical protein